MSNPLASVPTFIPTLLFFPQPEMVDNCLKLLTNLTERGSVPSELQSDGVRELVTGILERYADHRSIPGRGWTLLERMESV